MLRRFSSLLCQATGAASSSTVAMTAASAAAATVATGTAKAVGSPNEHKFETRRAVIPLEQRFAGPGLGKPETDTDVRASPLSFDVRRGGTTLKIKWRVQHLRPAGGASSDVPAVEEVTTTVTAELMRVCAPSTDVLSLPQNVAVSGKRGLTFSDLTLVGNYALRVSFSDGHTAGIFGYQYLFDLSGSEKWLRSRMYLETLKKCRRSRHPVQKRDGTSSVYAPAKDPIEEAVAKAEERERQEQAKIERARQLKERGLDPAAAEAKPKRELPNAAALAKKAAAAAAATAAAVEKK